MPLPIHALVTSGHMSTEKYEAMTGEPHVLASVRAWLDGASGADAESGGGSALFRALGAELSARLRAHLSTPATEPLFLGGRGYHALVDDWRLFRADTSRAVRDAFFVDVETVASLGAFAANAAVESWKKHGLRAPFDPSVTEEWGLPPGLPKTEWDALMAGAGALYADCVARTLAYDPPTDIPPAHVVAGSIPVFSPFDLADDAHRKDAAHAAGDNYPDSAEDLIRLGAALARPNYADETALFAARIPTFREAVSRVRETIERHSYTENETCALVDAVAPRWMTHENAGADDTWPLRRAWIGHGASYWAVPELRAIAAARLAEVVREKEELQRQLDEQTTRKSPHTPALRQSIGLLRAVTIREDGLKTARAKKLTVEQSEARELFRYEPIGWAERLVIHALAAEAREAGKLDAHPWALARRPLADNPAPRVRLPFPGIERLARTAGYEPGRDGRIKKDDRETIQRALLNLATKPRWIPEPVLVAVRQKGGKTKLIEDTRVSQSLWVEMSATELTHLTELHLHPVAIATHLQSFLPAENLAAEYRRAAESLKRQGIGGGRMRDEWSYGDDYFRYIASVKMGAIRGGERRKKEGADRMMTAGDQTVDIDTADSTLRQVLDLSRLRLSEAQTAQRVCEVFAFLKVRGTIHTATLDGSGVWRIVAPIPGARLAGVDLAQGLLPLPDSTEVDA